MMVRGFSETLPASGAWTRLGRVPVRAIQSVETLKEGAASLLAVDLYAVDVDAGGCGWVRLTGPQDAKTMRIGYSAGLAETWETIPEPVRQGIVRLTAHLYTHRDGGEHEGPPAVVTALWRPYRRIRLG